MSNNYQGSASAPSPASVIERVHFLERGLELVMAYADCLNDHYGARASQDEAQLNGSPLAAPFPNFREWAEQRETRLSKSSVEPAQGLMGGAEIRRDYRG